MHNVEEQSGARFVIVQIVHVKDDGKANIFRRFKF